MNETQMQKMFDDVYEDTKAETLRSMLKDFYNRQMLRAVILVWSIALATMVGMVLCGIQFFAVESVRSQIMYAVVFICLFLFFGDLKIFAWLMMNRNSLKREIKRLELRLVELAVSGRHDVTP